MVRLFVAIDLPEPVRERLAALCSGVPGARWVAPEQFHLTLRFIGEVAEDRFREIAAALPAAAGPPFSLALDGLGFFPPRGRPRVLWAGVAASEPLLALRTRVESALAAVGVEREGRRFAPHVTLARLKGTSPGRVGRFLEHHPLFRTDPFPVDRYLLYSSVLTRHGAHHRVEAAYPLTEARP
ncbi:MAG: RNA 2',3'-cyclic phosphodiesterase [Nitrospirae bacterium]|nr:MAG: RNA 2',3'-cyclic phosphodiesterase [Nitrospirota bacterium]